MHRWMLTLDSVVEYWTEQAVLRYKFSDQVIFYDFQFCSIINTYSMSARWIRDGE